MEERDALFPDVDKEATGSYIYIMKVVGLKMLKNRLSEYVRLAAGGETVLVTDRDTVVAELVSPSAGRSRDVADAMLAEAVRQGWVTPPALPQSGLPPRRPVCSWSELQAELQASREDR